MCVLLVEDEPMIREIMAESLQDAGFEVVAAHSGDQAIGLIADPHHRFSILVTDLHMPGNADGAQVAACMRELNPAIPVVIATGRPDVIQSACKDSLNYALLRKPYLPSHLVALVRDLVER